jgi:pentapeptide MXKDX repeat protein
MKRIVSALVASLALLVFATPSFAADTTTTKTTKTSSMSTMSGMKSDAMAKPVTCAKGQTMVKGYKKKDGTVVKPYCRKAK